MFPSDFHLKRVSERGISVMLGHSNLAGSFCLCDIALLHKPNEFHSILSSMQEVGRDAFWTGLKSQRVPKASFISTRDTVRVSAAPMFMLLSEAAQTPRLEDCLIKQ